MVSDNMQTTIERKELLAFTTTAKCGCKLTRVYRNPSPAVNEPIGASDLTLCPRHNEKSLEAKQCVKEVLYEVGFAALEQEAEYQKMRQSYMRPKPATKPEPKPYLMGAQA
jgi:hypothetical protein